MKAFIVLGLFALAASQRFTFPPIFSFGNDQIHGFTFEYHRHEDVMLIRNRTACFVVEVDKTIEDDLQHKDSREKIEDALYAQIKADQGETVSSLQELRSDLHDSRAVFECFRHDVYKLKYMST